MVRDKAMHGTVLVDSVLVLTREFDRTGAMAKIPKEPILLTGVLQGSAARFFGKRRLARYSSRVRRSRSTRCDAVSAVLGGSG